MKAIILYSSHQANPACQELIIDDKKSIHIRTEIVETSSLDEALSSAVQRENEDLLNVIAYDE